MTREEQAERHIKSKGGEIKPFAVYTVSRSDLYGHWNESFLAGWDARNQEVEYWAGKAVKNMNATRQVQYELEALRKENEQLQQRNKKLAIALSEIIQSHHTSTSRKIAEKALNPKQ